jgi:flagella basal body P-ring formation protein FlgA
MIRRALAFVLAAVCAFCAQAGASAPASAQSASRMQTIPAARITAVADGVARGLISGDDRSIAPAYGLADQLVPAGDVALSVSGTPFVSATYASVPVAISVDGKVARTVVAGYRITTYVRTAVAAHDLPPNTLLADGDVTIARVPSNGRPVVGADALLGRRLRLAASKNMPIYLEETAANQVVMAGQPAILLIHDGGVAVAADVVARTGGAIGDVVTVVNPQTNRALAGIVTGPARVEITLPGTGAR